MENLILNLKSITRNYEFYKSLIYTRNHLHHHYINMFKELYKVRKEFDYNDDDDDDDEMDKIPSFILSMRILDKHIQEIERNIQFIKGKYKYTFIKILLKLKLQYREDTLRLLHYKENGFI